MATIKAYTDLEQSKKLAEFLPIESADMHYVLTDSRQETYSPELGKYYGVLPSIPCRSLAALLDIIPYPSLHRTFSGWRCDSSNKEGTSRKFGEPSDNPVGACVEMILKLHELKML